jgi:predicted transcriptional regulator
MSRGVFSIRQDTLLGDVIQNVSDKRIKRIIVVNDENRLIGMVSRDDILRAIASGV